MFITEIELKTVAYSYQIEQITEGDTDIIYQSIAAAEEEVKSYLRPNNQRAWQDGRVVYDIDAVFAATGNNRNPLLVEQTKNCALWYLIRLCNVDMLYEHVKERYDRSIEWLKKVNMGDITLSLPALAAPTNETETKKPFRAGSREKFNHDY